MFLFQFRAPLDTTSDTSTTSYDMPAIWLLNANIARTSQYPTNANCSSWRSGGGEFDIFEVMNSTENLHFYSTIHDYQGTDDIETGIALPGYIERTPNSLMTGGVVFGSDGSATVFMSNSTSLDDTINNSDLNTWISNVETSEKAVTKSLTSVSNQASSSNGEAGLDAMFGNSFWFNMLTFFLSTLTLV
ncbi:unnamed protein product [Ambrosiozyma monospora]|uniref:Unnamed protein product n=1 Tax=Ambrosiozyma monospora TaxID=43982 RepID=A0ACB5T512_AMBMO|nr:unnamed protein product [Ambrosiozyma monospora]